MISSCSVIMAFRDTTWPPGEAGGRADEIEVLLEGETASGLDLFQLLDTGKVAIGQRRVQTCPAGWNPEE